MKCVKGKDGVIKRLSNEGAEKLVSLGKAKFSSKGAWKRYCKRGEKEQ
jgi:hypothetical protein